MGMKFLLDTNTCIAHLRSPANSTVSRRLAGAGYDSVALCAVVKAELLYGALHSLNVEENQRKLEQFFKAFPSLPFDDAAAMQYGSVRSQLAANGTPIGPNDLMIASIALANRLVLVTHNTTEFKRVPGLQIEDWEA